MAGVSVAGASTYPTTLIQYLQTHNTPQVKYLTWSFIEAGDPGENIPIETYNDLTRNGARQLGGLPTAGFRDLNENVAAQTITPTRFSEQVYPITNPIDIDKFTLGTQSQINGVGDWEFQIDGNVKGIAFYRANVFINNSDAAGTLLTNVKAPVGLLGRFQNTAKYGVNPNCSINSAVDLSLANWSRNNFIALLAAIDKGLQEMGVRDGKGVVYLINDPLERAINATARLASGGGGFSIDTDQFGRTITTYRGGVFQNLARNAPDIAGNQQQYIISNAEDATGGQHAGAPSGSNTFTSLWMVKAGEKNGFTLWQKSPLSIRKTPMDLPGGTFQEVVIDWSMGMWQQYTRSIVRLYNINLSGV